MPASQRLNSAGMAMLKRHEGCRLEAYLCPAGVLTIGYGHTGDVAPGHRITQHQADVLLAYDVERFEGGVAGLFLGVPLSDNEFSALVCLAFNIGLAALGRSTLRRRLLAGDREAAAAQFGRWSRAGGKRLPGLVKRRAEERELFLTPERQVA